mgnify:CR=1 FL=1
MSRRHWENCITHFDADADTFLREYFTDPARKCLIVAGAGFDPRSSTISSTLAGIMGSRLSAILFREERGETDRDLRAAADKNESLLKGLIRDIEIVPINIFADDGAPVGGMRIREYFQKQRAKKDWLKGYTDVVLDLSAISIGLSFPTALILLKYCEHLSDINFHLILASNPALDGCISSEPDDQVRNVLGFSHLRQPSQEGPLAGIWLPQLAPGKKSVLEAIRSNNPTLKKICPVLPFPARDPREADNLISEYCDILQDGWKVDTRDFIYVSERNPLDSYRTISELLRRYEKATKDYYVPNMILSPLGSKVMAVGALMAAIEHELTIQYIETLRYSFDADKLAARSVDETDSEIVHVWLAGPLYDGYGNNHDTI